MNREMTDADLSNLAQPLTGRQAGRTAHAGQHPADEEGCSEHPRSGGGVRMGPAGARQLPLVPAEADVVPGHHGVSLGNVLRRRLIQRGGHAAERGRRLHQPVRRNLGDACIRVYDLGFRV